MEFLQRLPADRVVQLHFAGGHWHQDMLVDSHSQPAPPQVWSLLETVLEKFNVKAVLLERDKNLPPFTELLDELRRARELRQVRRQ